MPKRTLIPLKEVLARTGLSKTGTYERMAAGTFPRPVKLGPGMSRWVDEEVDNWIDEQIKARDHESGQSAAAPGSQQELSMYGPPRWAAPVRVWMGSALGGNIERYSADDDYAAE